PVAAARPARAAPCNQWRRRALPKRNEVETPGRPSCPRELDIHTNERAERRRSALDDLDTSAVVTCPQLSHDRTQALQRDPDLSVRRTQVQVFLWDAFGTADAHEIGCPEPLKFGNVDASER